MNGRKRRRSYSKGMSIAAQNEWQDEKKLVKGHDVHMFSLMKGIVIQGPIFIGFFHAAPPLVKGNMYMKELYHALPMSNITFAKLQSKLGGEANQTTVHKLMDKMTKEGFIESANNRMLEPISLNKHGMPVMNNAATEAAHSFTLFELRNATKNFEKKVGSGVFGTVYYGKLNQNTKLTINKA